MSSPAIAELGTFEARKGGAAEATGWSEGGAVPVAGH